MTGASLDGLAMQSNAAAAAVQQAHLWAAFGAHAGAYSATQVAAAQAHMAADQHHLGRRGMSTMSLGHGEGGMAGLGAGAGAGAGAMHAQQMHQLLQMQGMQGHVQAAMAAGVSAPMDMLRRGQAMDSVLSQSHRHPTSGAASVGGPQGLAAVGMPAGPAYLHFH